VLTPATTADHIVPHRGDQALFRGPLQSLCTPCHSARKQAQEAQALADERRSFSREVDVATGLPLDPAHPFNRGVLPKADAPKR
jgi:5-methylcytosine-specific restriction protein A